MASARHGVREAPAGLALVQELLNTRATMHYGADLLLLADDAQRWLTETTKYRLREGLTRDLLTLWMAPRRAFWLATWITPMLTSAPTVAAIRPSAPRNGAAAVFKRPHCSWYWIGET